MNISLTQTSKPTQFWLYTSAYGIATLFFLANFYSYGMVYATLPLLFAAVLAGPIFGYVFLGLDALVLKITTSYFAKSIDLTTYQMIMSRSKAPSLFLVALWAGLIIANPTSVFIQDASNESAVVIVLSTLIGYVSSFFLLLKGLRKLHNMPFPLAFICAFIVHSVSFFIYASLLFIVRYIYISLL